jgi:hypothetical protein
VLIGASLAKVILTLRVPIGAESRDLDHPGYSGNDARIKQRTRSAHVNRIESITSPLAKDPSCIDHSIDSVQLRHPIERIEIPCEVGGSKLRAGTRLYRATGGANYGVTSAMQGFPHVPTDESGSTGQEDTHTPRAGW